MSAETCHGQGLSCSALFGSCFGNSWRGSPEVAIRSMPKFSLRVRVAFASKATSQLFSFRRTPDSITIVRKIRMIPNRRTGKGRNSQGSRRPKQVTMIAKGSPRRIEPKVAKWWRFFSMRVFIFPLQNVPHHQCRLGVRWMRLFAVVMVRPLSCRPSIYTSQKAASV